MVEITEVSKEEELASSSSTSSRAGWKYDVFLSFRGEDTRKTFVDHLYSALQRSGIHTFKDDLRLETGESISPALLKAIEESMFAVVVFSKNYASSRWCLDELVKIMDCRAQSSRSSIGPQTVFPIFYDVEPSYVRKPDEGYFGEILVRKHDPAKVETWRKALGEAANLAGVELKNTADGHESKCIEVIIEKIWKKLLSTVLSESEDLVGMKSRIEEVTSLMDLGSNVVSTVGIYGLSGIGKSTLAGAIYDKIKNQFEVAYFLDNVGEASKMDGLKHLQQKLLSEILMVKDLHIMRVREGIELLKTRLCSRSVLLVLDDVDRLEQLEALAGSHGWFGRRSRIMITTKDKQLLVAHNVDKTHEASVLEDVDATKLFYWKAFNGICPTKDFEELSIQVMRYASGLPLALKVFGSALRDRDMAFWKSALVKLRKEGPEGEILEKLKIGFDGLERAQKETFLDIACFFEGKNKEHVERKLDSFEFYPNTSIPVLVDRSLIHCSDGRVCMHQLIKEMGRHIVRKDFPQEPGKRSRLWDAEEIKLVLENNTGTENIEAILLNFPQFINIEMGSEAFRKMTNLRLLEIQSASFRQGRKYDLPDGIQWIVWYRYPSNSLPKTFTAYRVVGLQLPGSNIKQLWKGRKMMDKLKYIDLEGSRKLIETPDFTGTPNLEELILRGCTNLVVVHQSLGALKRLVHVNLQICENLRTLPNSIRSECLKTFILTGCYKLQKIPEIPVIMEDLSDLRLERTAIRELPSSIQHLPNLVSLDLQGCQNLASLPSTICKLRCLKQLSLSKCSKFDKLPEDLGCLECLELLNLDKTAIKEVPSSIEHLSNLVTLSLSKCKNIRSFPSAICKLKHLKYLNLSWCLEVDKLGEELGNLECLEVILLDGIGIKEVPSSIEHLSNLVTLSLSKCKNIRSFPSAICKLKHLKYLNLSWCSEVDKLGEELGNLECLEVLLLDGIRIKEVPSSIEHLSSLVQLCLRDCKNLPCLPSAICRLKRLEWLFLSGCSELEKLPEELVSLECLVWLDLDGTAITQLPLSIGCLNNLQFLTFHKCSQLSTTSAFPLSFRLKRKRQEEDSLTRSLLLRYVSGLRSLRTLDVSGCNMLYGAISNDLESLCSLEKLVLSQNCNVELPSLNQLSRLSELYLDGCKKLEALPELPSSIKILSADDCPSLRVSADRFTNTKNLLEVSFANCLQLLGADDTGESKSIARTFWHMIQETKYSESTMVLPGREIPESVSHSTTQLSITLKLPLNCSDFGGLVFCVAFDPRYKATPLAFTFPGRGKKVAGIRFEFTLRNRSKCQVRFYDECFIKGKEKNISREHVCLGYISLCFLNSWERNDWCEMEVSIKYSSSNSAAVTKWGISLLPACKINPVPTPFTMMMMPVWYNGAIHTCECRIGSNLSGQSCTRHHWISALQDSILKNALRLRSSIGDGKGPHNILDLFYRKRGDSSYFVSSVYYV